MKPQSNFQSTSESSYSFVDCYDLSKIPPSKHSIQWNFEFSSKLLENEDLTVKEEQSILTESPSSKHDGQMDQEKDCEQPLVKERSGKPRAASEQLVQKEESSKKSKIQKEQIQYLKKENKRLSQYLRKIMVLHNLFEEQNQQLNQKIIALTNKVAPSDIVPSNSKFRHEEMVIQQNREFRKTINKFIWIFKEIRDKLEATQKANDALSSVLVSQNYESYPEVSNLKETIQTLLCGYQQSSLQNQVISSHEKQHQQIRQKLEACQALNKELEAKIEELDQENEELFQRIKSLDRLCMMKGQQYEENLETMMGAYQQKINGIVGVIKIGEYDKQMALIKSEKQRVGFLLKEKSNGMVKLQEKMKKKLEKIEELQLENAELYTQLRQSMSKNNKPLGQNENISQLGEVECLNCNPLKLQKMQLQSLFNQKEHQCQQAFRQIQQVKQKLGASCQKIGELEASNSQLKAAVQEETDKKQVLLAQFAKLRKQFMTISHYYPKLKQQLISKEKEIQKGQIENKKLKVRITQLCQGSV